MVSASACVGFTLPGMIELPGSFSGMVISPMPQRGPLESSRTSLAILMSDAASVFQRAVRVHQRVVGGERLELVGRRDERQPVSARDLRGDARAELRMRVEAGADRGAAERELATGAAATPRRARRACSSCAT